MRPLSLSSRISRCLEDIFLLFPSVSYISFLYSFSSTYAMEGGWTFLSYTALSLVMRVTIARLSRLTQLRGEPKSTYGGGLATWSSSRFG